MKCVSTLSYSVQINESPYGNVTPERGIRQGDPLSPYPFIIRVEVLSHIMKKAEATKKIPRIMICNRGPSITHLLLPDNSLFFTLANQKSCKAIKKILRKYEEACQSENLRKLSITFDGKVNHEVKRRMRNILGIHNDGGCGKYLGLPEQFHKKSQRCFNLLWTTSKKNSWLE